MKLEVGKTYLMKKRTEPKVYPVIVDQESLPGVYSLDILTTKHFKKAYYNSDDNTLFNASFQPLKEWYLETGDQVESIKKCDCGGFKTYDSYEPHYHSHWCEINKQVKHESKIG